MHQSIKQSSNQSLMLHVCVRVCMCMWHVYITTCNQCMCVYAPCTINTCKCIQTAKHTQHEVCNHVCLHMYVLQCVLNCLTHTNSQKKMCDRTTHMICMHSACRNAQRHCHSQSSPAIGTSQTTLWSPSSQSLITSLPSTIFFFASGRISFALMILAKPL